MIRRIEALAFVVVWVSACAAQPDEPRNGDHALADAGGGDVELNTPGQVICDTATSEEECLVLGCERWVIGFAREITGVVPDENTCFPPQDNAGWCLAPGEDQGGNLCECMILWKPGKVIWLPSVTNALSHEPTDWKRCTGAEGEPPECECATLFCKPGDC